MGMNKEPEDKLLIENLELNLGRGLKGTFNLYLDKEGRLDIVPFNKVGDLSDWSYVLTYNKTKEDYDLASKQWEYDEEE